MTSEAERNYYKTLLIYKLREWSYKLQKRKLTKKILIFKNAFQYLKLYKMKNHIGSAWELDDSFHST